jgi:hypothetical protein
MGTQYSFPNFDRRFGSHPAQIDKIGWSGKFGNEYCVPKLSEV